MEKTEQKILTKLDSLKIEVYDRLVEIDTHQLAINKLREKLDELNGLIQQEQNKKQ